MLLSLLLHFFSLFINVAMVKILKSYLKPAWFKRAENSECGIVRSRSKTDSIPFHSIWNTESTRSRKLLIWPCQCASVKVMREQEREIEWVTERTEKLTRAVVHSQLNSAQLRKTEISASSAAANSMLTNTRTSIQRNYIQFVLHRMCARKGNTLCRMLSLPHQLPFSAHFSIFPNNKFFLCLSVPRTRDPCTFGPFIAIFLPCCSCEPHTHTFRSPTHIGAVPRKWRI